MWCRPELSERRSRPVCSVWYSLPCWANRTPVELTAKQKQYLRSLAHPQKPLVQIGTKGIPDSVVEQISEQLSAHELIKVRFNTESSVEPADVAGELTSRTKSQLVQSSGRVLVLYRRHDEKPKIELPKAKRPARSAS
jgi:RNA-binding protein